MQVSSLLINRGIQTFHIEKYGQMPTHGSQQPDHSYDLVLDLLRERIVAQFEQVSTLDSKANGIMTIATALLGSALVFQAALFAISPHAITLTYTRLQGVTLALLIIYLMTMIITTVSGYWVRNFSRAPEPDRLTSYALKPLLDTQSFMVGSMTEAFNKNKDIIACKVWGMRIATLLLICEIMTLGVLLYMQTHN
jgi:hypothetical protein